MYGARRDIQQFSDLMRSQPFFGRLPDEFFDHRLDLEQELSFEICQVVYSEQLFPVDTGPVKD
jgi:hypothetical protein